MKTLTTSVLFLISLSALASASPIVFTANTMVGGEPVNAEADFTLGSGTAMITLKDLLANPHDVGQLVSDISFSISGASGSPALSSSSGQEVTVADDGTYTLGSTVATGWIVGLDNSGNILLCDVCGNGVTGSTAAPSHLIIGPPDASNTYSNANSSIANETGPHNPFLSESAVFNLSIPGVNADSTVSNVVFSFGTTFGSDASGTPGGGPSVPEPATFLLIGGGLVACALVCKQRGARRS